MLEGTDWLDSEPDPEVEELDVIICRLDGKTDPQISLCLANFTPSIPFKQGCVCVCVWGGGGGGEGVGGQSIIALLASPFDKYC